MIARFGEPVVPTQRYTLRPGAYAILPNQGSILVTMQHGDRPDLQLPGGGIDAGESPRHALYREILEETGWSVGTPRRLGAFRRFVFMPEYDLWAEKLCHVYVARPARKVQEPTEPDHETIWMPLDQATDALGNAGDRFFLQKFMSLSGL